VGTYNYLQLSLALTADVKYKRGKFIFIFITSLIIPVIKNNNMAVKRPS